MPGTEWITCASLFKCFIPQRIVFKILRSCMVGTASFYPCLPWISASSLLGCLSHPPAYDGVLSLRLISLWICIEALPSFVLRPQTSFLIKPKSLPILFLFLQTLKLHYMYYITH